MIKIKYKGTIVNPSLDQLQLNYYHGHVNYNTEIRQPAVCLLQALTQIPNGAFSETQNRNKISRTLTADFPAHAYFRMEWREEGNTQYRDSQFTLVHLNQK